MLFIINELKKVASLPEKTTTDEIASAITKLGFEVEQIIKPKLIEGLKYGKIESISKNPTDEKLNVCTINFKDKKRIIQTNAPNVFEGMHVVAFVEGSKIDDIVFGAKVIKGIKSEGMLTNIEEFGIKKDLIREEDLNIITPYKGVAIDGDPIKDLYLDSDIIEADILSNRSDASSYYIMATELASYFGTIPNIPKPKKGSFDSKIKVKTGEANQLAFIETTKFDKVSVKEKIFLALHNIKSTGDASDISNLTLLYAGQPTHVYNKNDIKGVLTAKMHTGNVKVFGNKEVLLKDNLSIANDNNVLSVASVIGIEEFKVDDKQEVLFEIGIFNTSQVRKSLRTVKIDTKSGIKGSKKIEDGTIELAIIYLSNRLKTFSNTLNFNPKSKKIIELSLEKVSNIFGSDITKHKDFNKVLKSLKTLGFIINNKKVTIPSYRHDIEIQEDLNEEIIRLIGFKNIVSKIPTIYPSKITNEINYKQKISSLGFQEVKTYTLISLESNIFNPFNFSKEIKLNTFVSKEREVVRNSQISPIISIANYNLKRGMNNINIFSKGMINDGFITYIMATNNIGFNEFQQHIINLIPGVNFKRCNIENMHPNICAFIYMGNEKIGIIGKLHPKYGDLFICEFIDSDYSISSTFKKYDDSPLKYNDENIVLNIKQDLGEKFKKDDEAFSETVIDKYKNDGKIKLTVRKIK